MADLYSILAAGHDRSHIDGLDETFRNALSALIAGAPPELAGQIGIQSGFRSPERQAELYQQALAKYGSPEAARKWVAPPGKSNHNHGGAADLSYGSDAAKKWVHDNAGNFGLGFRMSHEPWHIEPAGGHAAHAAVTQAPDGPKGQEAWPANPMQSPAPVAAPPAATPQSAIGAMIAGLGDNLPVMGENTAPATRRPDVADNAMPVAAAQMAERGKGLKSAFMPDLDAILGMARRPV